METIQIREVGFDTWGEVALMDSIYISSDLIISSDVKFLHQHYEKFFNVPEILTPGVTI